MNSNLSKQLNSLKTIEADKAWKEKNRQVLISQIYGTNDVNSANAKGWSFYFKMPIIFARSISQPTFAALLIFLFIVSGGTVSLRMAEKTNPGDSLYIAKIAGEKTQYAFTFDEKEKAKLNLEFAQNRIEEVTRILAQSNEADNEKVGTLLDNYKKEISEVKNRISKIDPKSEAIVPANENIDGESVFHSANLNKDNNGIQLSDPAEKDSRAEQGEVEKSNASSTIINNSATGEQATSTASGLTDTISNATIILQEAVKLLGEDKYNDTLVKLEEVNKSISQVDSKTEIIDENIGTSTTTAK